MNTFVDTQTHTQTSVNGYFLDASGLASCPFDFLLSIVLEETSGS